MKITEALMEQMQATSAGDTDVMTVAPIAVNQQVLELLANSYVTVIVVIVVIVILVVGLAIYKSYTTWASTRTTRRRHSSRSSQQAWLYPDNPEMLDESLDSDGERPFV